MQNNDSSNLFSQEEKTIEQHSLNDAICSIDKFIIQINKINLLDYFGCGLIHPENYDTRELARSQRAIDIQHSVPDYLIITDGFADTPNKDQVLLDVVLTDFDKKSLIKLNENIYLLPYSLPISRVVKIYFISKESQDNSIASTKTFQDTFLPMHLFAIWKNEFETRAESVKQAISVNIPPNENLKIECQNHFDRILGMLAFMKNTELYYTNETFEFANYSEKYFQVLRLINPSLFNVLEITELDKDIMPYYQALLNPENQPSQDILHKIVKNIYENKAFKKDIIRQILNSPSQEINTAFSLLMSDETLNALNAIYKSKAKDKWDFILLALLYRFRNKDGSDKFALKEQITYLFNHEKFDERTINRANLVLATLGLYYGYRSLPKDELINLNDYFYSSFSDERGKFPIKYKLDSLLDRQTIESVYQYCFFEGQQSNFDYLFDDKNEIRYDLRDGYSDEKTFSFIENHPIIRITKTLNEKQQEIIIQTPKRLEEVTRLLNVLLNYGLIPSNIKINDTGSFDIKISEYKLKTLLLSNNYKKLETELKSFTNTAKNESTNNNG